jgi:hypothetical protein
VNPSILQPSPICLFAYNRPVHLKRTLDALQCNPLASESELIIYSDGPKAANEDAAVKEVRSLCRNVSGFKSVRIVEQPSNRGLSHSIISGVTETCEAFGRAIVLEDDLVVSRSFLDYMNTGLQLYENDKSVFSIHGYVFPVKAQLPETFFLLGADCWGWATWSRAWREFEADGSELLRNLARQGLLRRLDFNGAYDYTGMLKQQIAGEVNSWAIRWQASALLKGGLTLYPGRSLVRNIGFDDTGTHGYATDKFDVDISHEPVHVKRRPLSEDRAGFEAFAAYYRSIRPSIVRRTARWLMRRLT